MSGSTEAGYSAIADQQLNELEAAGNLNVYVAVLETCEFILDNPGTARRKSAAVRTHQGIVFRTPVKGRPEIKVFWTSSGPRIEAVFPYPG